MNKIKNIINNNGLILYDLGVSLQPMQVIMIKDSFTMVGKKYDNYFELNDLGEPFEKSIGDDFFIASGVPITEFTTKPIKF